MEARGSCQEWASATIRKSEPVRSGDEAATTPAATPLRHDDDEAPARRRLRHGLYRGRRRSAARLTSCAPFTIADRRDEPAKAMQKRHGDAIPTPARRPI